MTVGAFPPPAGTRASLAVLDITKFFGETTGGIRTYLLEKAGFFGAREDLRQTIVVPGATNSVEDRGGVRWYRIRGPRIPSQHPYRFLLGAGMVRRIVEHERPDLIEVGSPYLVPWITRRAVRRSGIPLVWFFHTNFPRIISPRPERDGGLRRTAGAMAEWYVGRLSRVFHAAVGASHAAVQELERGGFRLVERIGLGVDLDQFHPRRREHRHATRLRYGLPSGPLALYAGRMAREKELGLVLDAWPQVERVSGGHLVMLGDGPSRGYFQHRTQASHVTWLPYETDRERLADLLASADLYLAPGPAETFGLAALEAMASGVPVLSSDRGAVRELVDSSGAGLVNPEPTCQSMAESLLYLFSRDLAALGALGRRYAEAHHAWPLVFDRLVTFYRRVLAEARA